jgi:hypothetical protein
LCATATWNESEIDFGLTELRSCSRDANVAGLCEFTAAAERVTVDSGDDRNRGVVDGFVDPWVLAGLALLD